MLAGAEAVAADALAAIAGDGQPAPVNTIGAARAEVAERPDGELAWVEAPSYGIGSAAGAGPDVARATERGDRVVLENGLLRAELTRDGRLVSLVHLAGDREALEQPGNVFQLYDDRPTAYEAWDVDPFHLETVRDAGPAESCAVTAAGRAAGAGGAAIPDRDGQHAAPAGAAGRGCSPGSSSTARSTGGSAGRC